MALVELLIRIGDNGPWLDGMVVEHRRPGLWVTAAEIDAWLADPKAIPAGVQGLRRTERKRLKREGDRLRYFIDPAFDAQAAADAMGMPLGWALNEQQQHLDWYAAIQEHGGWDTVWHYQEMKTFGIVQADLTRDDIEELVTQDFDPTAPPQALPVDLFVRGWRLAYENVAPAGLIADWQDPAILRLPVRAGPGIPLDLTHFEEIDAP